MSRPAAAIAVCAGALLQLTACATLSARPTESSESPPAATSRPSASPADDKDVITFYGLPSVPIGTSLNTLTSTGILDIKGPGCGPLFTSMPYANPVIYQEQLVLIWAYPPLHTPEGVMVGTPIGQARQAYPGAIDLSPAKAGQFRGLLVLGPGNLSYLFLHDDVSVQKLVIGYQTYARKVVAAGFGTC